MKILFPRKVWFRNEIRQNAIYLLKIENFPGYFFLKHYAFVQINILPFNTRQEREKKFQDAICNIIWKK